jgi:uncharacterized membrane protein YidH (DUF202 family)
MLYWLLPKIAYANVDTFVLKLNRIIINPLIAFFFAVALVMFIAGIVRFVANQDKEDERTKGKKHMLWGLVGMFIMVMVFTIMRIILNTLGIDGIDVRGGGVDIQ